MNDDIEDKEAYYKQFYGITHSDEMTLEEKTVLTWIIGYAGLRGGSFSSDYHFIARSLSSTYDVIRRIVKSLQKKHFIVLHRTAKGTYQFIPTFTDTGYYDLTELHKERSDPDYVNPNKCKVRGKQPKN